VRSGIGAGLDRPEASVILVCRCESRNYARFVTDQKEIRACRCIALFVANARKPVNDPFRGKLRAYSASPPRKAALLRRRVKLGETTQPRSPERRETTKRPARFDLEGLSHPERSIFFYLKCLHKRIRARTHRSPPPSARQNSADRSISM